MPVQKSSSWPSPAVLGALVALVLGCALPAAAGASTFTVAGAGAKPDVAVDPATGTGFFAWNRPGDTAADSDVTQLCRIPRGGSVCQDLQSLIPPQPSSNHEAAVPRVLVSGSRVFVLTTRGSNDTVWRFTSADGGATFDTGQPVGDDGYDPLADAVLGPGETITTISAGGVLRSRPLTGTGASAPIDVLPGAIGNATIALADGGHALVVGAGDDGQLYLARQVGADIASLGSWTAPVAIGAGASPRLVNGPSGTWLFSDHVPAPVDVRRFDGSGFGAGASVTGAQAVGSEHAFTADAAGGLEAVYRSTGEGGLQGGVVTTSSADGVAWTPLQELADRSIGAFSLRVAAVGAKDGFAVWQRDVGTSEILGAALGTATSPGGGGGAGGSTCPAVSFRPVEALSLDGCWTQQGTAYVAPGKVRVNGLDLDPKAGAKVVVDPTKRTIVTQGGAGALVHAGLIPIDAGPIAWNVANASTSHVTDGDTGTLGADLFGLAIRGTSSVDFQAPNEATIAAHVALPKLFGDVTGDVKLRTDNAQGLRLDGIDVAVTDALLGPLEIKNLSLKYVAAGAVWQGAADLVLPPHPPGARLTAGFGLKGGAFDYANGSFEFPAPGLAMAPSVFLNEIHFSLTTNPTKILGGVKLTAGPQIGGTGAVGIEGDLSYTFADLPKPSILKATGKGSVVGVPIADVALEYRSSGLFTFGAHLDYSFASAFHVNAGIDGFVDTSASTFMVDGSGKLTCAIPILCPLEVHAVMSSKGVAFCGTKTILAIPASVGIGYRWGKGVDVFLFTGCDLDDYKVQASAAQAGGTRGVRLGGGRFAVVAVAGVGGGGAAPDVALQRPGGGTVTTKAIPDAEHGVTYLFVPHPKAGSYRLVPAAGSPAIGRVAVAGALPKPSVRGRVSGGHGRTRTLTYAVAPIARQKVTFTEESGAVARRLGTAHGARGRLRFTPGYGPAGRRTIYALVEQDGRPRAKLVVARYSAPAPARPATPRGLAVRRSKRTVTATWRRVAGIRAYRVEAKLTDGRHTIQLVTGTRLRLDDVAPKATGTITVAAATPDLRTSRPAKAKVLKLGAKPKAKRRRR